MSTAALSDRDANELIASTTADNKTMAAGTENKPQGGDSNGKTSASNNMRRQMFAAGSGEQTGSKTYVSPSDAIQSPASQKLAKFKQKQISKQGAKNPTARSLFARTASSCSSGGFEDVPVQEKDEAESGH